MIDCGECYSLVCVLYARETSSLALTAKLNRGYALPPGTSRALAPNARKDPAHVKAIRHQT